MRRRTRQCCHLKGELAFTTGRMLCSAVCTPSALMLLRRCLPSAARSESDVPFPRKLTTRIAVSRSGKPAARLRSTAIPLRPSVANGKVFSSAWARFPRRATRTGSGRHRAVGGKAGRRQFQKGQGPPRAGAGESRRRHGDPGRQCPRGLLWHTKGMGHFVLEVKRVLVDPPARGHVRRLDRWPDWSSWQPRPAPGGSYFKPAADNQKQKPCTRRSA